MISVKHLVIFSFIIVKPKSTIRVFDFVTALWILTFSKIISLIPTQIQTAKHFCLECNLFNNVRLWHILTNRYFAKGCQLYIEHGEGANDAKILLPVQEFILIRKVFLRITWPQTFYHFHFHFLTPFSPLW